MESALGTARAEGSPHQPAKDASLDLDLDLHDILPNIEEESVSVQQENSESSSKDSTVDPMEMGWHSHNRSSWKGFDGLVLNS